MKKDVCLIIPLLIVFLFFSCNKCNDADCPAGPLLIYKINVVDNLALSVYGSSTTQFDRNDLSVNSSAVSLGFEDTLIVAIPRISVKSFTINYNDSLSTIVQTKYKKVTPNDDCCSDYDFPIQILVDGLPCDSCAIIQVVVN